MSTASCNNSPAYNFDTLVDRKNTYSCKWDFFAKHLGDGSSHIPDDLIPMWIADMDLMVAPPIVEALRRTVEHGIYGYSDAPPEVATTVATWLQKEHAWAVEPRSVVYTTAAMTALHFILRSLTKKGDTVIAYEPSYPPIFSYIQESGRRLVKQSLKKERDDSGKERYAMDFEALDEALKEAKVLVLCNPHNPTGSVWTHEELVTLVQLCQKHEVIICSDDVHADIVYTPHAYKPIEAIAREVAPEFVSKIITLLSPNKIFNTGGIKIAMMIIPDEEKRMRIAQKQKACLGSSLDIFGITSLHAAYAHGADWKAALIEHLTANRDFLTRYIEEHCEGLAVVPAQATYLAWLDFSAYMENHSMSYADLQKLLIQEARVGLSAGNVFGASGINHMRLNFGCPRTTLEEGLARISHALFPSNKREARGTSI